MKETQLVASIMKYLEYRNDIYAWRNNTGALVNDGRFLAIEAKIGKNKQSDFQEAFQARVEAVGGLYVLAYSLDDVIAGLK